MSDPETFKPGTEVRADESVGGYSAVVILPQGAFRALQGDNWRTVTRVQVTDPAGSNWDPGALVDVETSLLSRKEEL